MTREERLIRLLVRESINEYSLGNFKLPQINLNKSAPAPSQTPPTGSAAQKYLDAHFSGDPKMKKDNATVQKLISSLPANLQQTYKDKLKAQSQPKSQQNTDHLSDNEYSKNRTQYRQDRAEARADGWIGESKPKK